MMTIKQQLVVERVKNSCVLDLGRGLEQPELEQFEVEELEYSTDASISLTIKGKNNNQLVHRHMCIFVTSEGKIENVVFKLKGDGFITKRVDKDNLYESYLDEEERTKQYVARKTRKITKVFVQ